MTMSYKGYLAGPIVFDDEQGVFSGTVEGLRDVVHFTGTTAIELSQSFRESVDDYLDLCRARGRTPDRPYSGRFLVRTSPDVHRAAALSAAREGVSLNQWVERQLESAAKP